VQTDCVGGREAIGDPSTDPSPKDGHRVYDGWGGAPHRKSVQENRS